ncbi:hypothetical protein RGR602_CH01863 [Rhizobium gallicum bv. gallicum R602sp]|uniref:Uncharacterized protein n=1 Tax=Rhizobium gallicum bv. gallicum R602sp TaxID=1041138 RepID=A0A0B4WZT0_9HYPH|nr:hypothetical protein RGR602_CH01863 [Rhizobium gallicum bv. gallicum R602sp]
MDIRSPERLKRGQDCHLSRAVRPIDVQTVADAVVDDIAVAGAETMSAGSKTVPKAPMPDGNAATGSGR